MNPLNDGKFHDSEDSFNDREFYDSEDSFNDREFYDSEDSFNDREFHDSMNPLTDDEFLDFLKFFNKKRYIDGDGIVHKCYDSLTELSKSETAPFDSIITNDFEMYGLDWMARVSDKWKINPKKCQRNPKRCKFKLPKTTDAIWCKRGENGNLVLHLIEFKFVSVKPILSKIDYFINDFDVFVADDFAEDLKDVIDKNFVGRIDNSLQLKPYETLFIVLPELYEEYCEINGIPKKDFKSYLANMEKYFWICIDSKSPNESNLRTKAKHFEKYCKRMEPPIFAGVYSKIKLDFEDSLKEDILPN